MSRRVAIVGAGIAAAAALTTGVAHAGAATNTAGSGAVNPSNYYDAGVTATWSQTVVQNNGWNEIVNATITTTGPYGWHQTYTLTEKQKTAGGSVTVTGTVLVANEYASDSEDIAPLTVDDGIDIPFGNLPGGGVFTEDTSAVGAALRNTETNIVYDGGVPLVNADYWFGF